MKKRKTDYSDQKQYKQYKHQQSKKKSPEKKWEQKQLYGHFKQQTNEISHEKTWTWLRKGNLKSETENLESNKELRHKDELYHK